MRGGRISFHIAGLVATGNRHFDPDRRRTVDALIATGGPAGSAPRQAAAPARRHAYAADPHGYLTRGRTARRVTVRPAPDTMSVLSGLLPVEHGVACWPRCVPTSFTNGRATCGRSDQVREVLGRPVRLVHDGSGDHPHTVATTIPTGHTCTSRAGPSP